MKRIFTHFYKKAGKKSADSTSDISTEPQVAIRDEEQIKLQDDTPALEMDESLDEYTRFYVRDIRRAIENKEFFLEYQPRVETKQGKIAGAEALLRWEHPEWGVVSPGEFIPAAEESGLIIDIGYYVMDKICEQLKSWKQKGVKLVPVSINISPKSLLENDFIPMLKSSLEKSRVDPALIEIELTESSFLKYADSVVSVFSELEDMGVKISLDGFGTGYSSLIQLKRFKFHLLKIDQTFIQHLDTCPEDATIISNLINLAHGLNMKVVAEGVETFEQYHILRQKECEQVQGFLFSKPVPPDIFVQKLETGRIKPKDQTKETAFKKRRKYFRIDLPFPLAADMTILTLHNKKVEMGSTEVIIEDIGPGGLRFLSNIKLPVRKDIILNIETELLGKTISLTGIIAWKEEISEKNTQYGFEFILQQQQQAALLHVLNYLQVQLKKGNDIPDSRFVQTESSQMYFE